MRSKPLPKALVERLTKAGYSASNIARLCGVSVERICQIRGLLGLTPPRAQTPTDLPDDLRIELERYLKDSTREPA